MSKQIYGYDTNIYETTIGNIKDIVPLRLSYGTYISLEDFNKIIDGKDKEIERLNNIINEFEKWLKAHLEDEFYWFKMYDKLQGLKGSDKE